jgi:hypothetical protein
LKLREELLKLSKAKEWALARAEWDLHMIEELDPHDEPEECLCGHSPIRELCWLKNKETESLALVGNVCVQKFTGLGSAAIFRSIAKVKKVVGRALALKLIYFAHREKAINDWELTFYVDTHRKRALSEKQAYKRAQINVKVLRWLDAAKRDLRGAK